MTIRFFSDKDRPVHMGPYPTERLARMGAVPKFDAVPDMAPLEFTRPEDPCSIVNAMREHQAMLDAIRDGLINGAVAEAPSDLQERADHLKAFGYFADAAVVGACALPDEALLKTPFTNPDVERLAHDLKTRQTKTLASGIDLIMADLKDSMEAPPTSIDGQTHALVFLYENPRTPEADEAGCAWIQDAQAHRAGMLAAETGAMMRGGIRFPALTWIWASWPSQAGLPRWRTARSVILILAHVSAWPPSPQILQWRPICRLRRCTRSPNRRSVWAGVWAPRPAKLRALRCPSQTAVSWMAHTRSRRSNVWTHLRPISTSRMSPACPNAPICSPVRNSAIWERSCRTARRAGTLLAVFSGRRRARQTDPQPRLQRQGAHGHGRRSAAAAAVASVGAGRSVPHRRGDPQPFPWPASQVRHSHNRPATGP